VEPPAAGVAADGGTVQVQVGGADDRGDLSHDASIEIRDRRHRVDARRAAALAGAWGRAGNHEDVDDLRDRLPGVGVDDDAGEAARGPAHVVGNWALATGTRDAIRRSAIRTPGPCRMSLRLLIHYSPFARGFCWCWSCAVGIVRP